MGTGSKLPRAPKEQELVKQGSRKALLEPANLAGVRGLCARMYCPLLPAVERLHLARAFASICPNDICGHQLLTPRSGCGAALPDRRGNVLARGSAIHSAASFIPQPACSVTRHLCLFLLTAESLASAPCASPPPGLQIAAFPLSAVWLFTVLEHR